MINPKLVMLVSIVTTVLTILFLIAVPMFLYNIAKILKSMNNSFVEYMEQESEIQNNSQ